MPKPDPQIATSFDLSNPMVQSFIDEHSYEFANETTDSLLTRLRDIWNDYLKEGMDAGETVFELTDKVANMFQGLDEREEWWRARRIARTESVGAANMGSLMGYEQAGVPYKQWVSQRDNLVRGTNPKDTADHVSMDGEIVPIDEPFDVDGIEMMAPGDPAGGPENVCNCRCVVLPVFGEYKRNFAKGGEGSGNFGHAGRPGEVGGSSKGGGAGPKPILSPEAEGLPSTINVGAGLGIVDKGEIKNLYSSLKGEVNWEGSRGKIARGALYNVAKAGSQGFLLKDGGEPVGITSMIPKKGDLYVEMLATKRGGYGQRMMVGIAQKAASKGYGLTLNAVPDAVGFYERLGMKKEGKPDQHGQQHFILSKRGTARLAKMIVKSLDELEPEDGVFCAPVDLLSIVKGGPGSGSWEAPGQPRFAHVGGAGSGKETTFDKPGTSSLSRYEHENYQTWATQETPSDRVSRALASYKPATAEIQRAGEANESKLARVIKGKPQPDNTPFDVVVGKHMIEVKTIVRGLNDKITMHPDSRQRKLEAAKKGKAVAHTVVFDNRNKKIFYKEGVGSFRLGGMKEVKLSELKGMFI